MVTPFGPSVAWVGAYLREVIAGKGDDDARKGANLVTGVSGKEFARCRLRGVTLTVPVEGGAHALKSRGALPGVSEHGKWRREHEGALLAAYGKTPYYAHLMPELMAVYADSEGLGLEDFNRRMLDVALGWIDVEALKAEGMERVRDEVRAKVETGLSIFDLLFRLGREGVWAL